MAGHSKWKNIRLKKGRVDAQKGKIFTKLSRDILMACRQGGGPDPEANYRLKDAIVRAREASMPRENIERALEKARGGGEGAELDEVVYEGYGPANIAIIVEAATNNRNRTAAEVRLIFSKNSGNFGETGSVAWLFDRKGQITGPSAGLDEDTLMEQAIEAGADDLEMDEDNFIITCEPTMLHEVRTALVNAKVPVKSSELTMIAKTSVEVSAADAPAVLKFMDLLEEHDDVTNVYTNFELSAEAVEAMDA
ncbi:MAG: YebC/PmpR family DNA-binding transcriptional regulator [Candidatus Eremiobacteraeota bacterium]|nr:YebC/PmpR family DNA-binding transcriptional regulator [Candidatus Eremiobacteraeota bacterium]MCW5869726.1 YebC/PmpR family DNA-binding transcriptional regulator [Candidatus Eremiobacteraeota bacterium]